MGAPPPSEKRQVVRYAFYKLDPAWRRLTAERQASAKIEFGETLERYHGRLLLRPYGLVGIRGDTDFLLWQVAEDLDALVELQTALNRTDLGAYLSIPYSYLAMTRRSIYEFPAPPEPGHEQRLVIQPSAAKYLFVYPFIKTRAWYALPKPERQRMMDEHVRVGRKYPAIRLNTTYSYGLDDQEFIVAFEGDKPGEFLDLVMELRESKASSYTLKDTPTFTCVQMSLWDMLDTLGGAGSAQAVSRRPARADGRSLKACRREPSAGTPVWFMRQAGRYMPEYRALRAKHSILELCHHPELAAKVTLQPIERLGVDAAILFADILLPFEPLGLGLSFSAGEGPQITPPIPEAGPGVAPPPRGPPPRPGDLFGPPRAAPPAPPPPTPPLPFSGP